MKKLPVQSLNFETIKENFRDFLKDNPTYQDWNFEASGISTLLNISSYQTHYIGFFVKMLLDEAFTESAHTRQALLSHAKRVSYIPKGRKAARAELKLTVNTDTVSEPAERLIAIERGTTFTSVNIDDDQRIFTILDGINLTDRFVDGSDVQYVSDTIVVYEGALRTWNFIVDSSVVNQKFVIRDPNIDIDTIRVRVKPDEESSSSQSYTLVQDVLDLQPDDPVFYVTTDESGYYQIFFGNNVFGNQPDDANVIEVTYISTNGLTGNGARAFEFNAPASGGAATNIGNFEDFVTETLTVAHGGLEPETVDELRFNIPNHWRRQGRAFTVPDFRSILTSEFRNISSINVWGGEENAIRNYGKIFVSIKPKFSDRLTSRSREEIKTRLLERYGYVGVDVVFVDPDFIEIDVDVTVKIDKRKTNMTNFEIRNSILDRISTYNSVNMSQFDQFFSEVDFLDSLREDYEFIRTVYCSKTLRKQYEHLQGSDSTNVVNFSNPIKPGSLSTGSISYGGTSVTIMDDSKGALYFMFNGAKIDAGTIDYATGIIQYKLPRTAKITGYENANFGLLEISVSPQIPDVNTSQNNIVRISKTKVTVT